MPEHLRVKTFLRNFKNEEPSDGDINVNVGFENHPVLSYPHIVNIQNVKETCLKNNLVEGIYWTYLEPFEKEYYNTIISDNSNRVGRGLFVSAREDLNYRIVITSLALDWQGIEDLWQNTIRYVVEGRPYLAILSKRNGYSFDFRYLMTYIQVNKLPYKEYILDKLDSSLIALNVHKTYILDPLWNSNEVQKFIEKISSEYIDTGIAEVLSFAKDLNLKPHLIAYSNGN